MSAETAEVGLAAPIGPCAPSDFVIAPPGAKPIVDNTNGFKPQCLQVVAETTVTFSGSVANMPAENRPDGPFGVYVVNGTEAGLYFGVPDVHIYHSRADASMEGVILVVAK